MTVLDRTGPDRAASVGARGTVPAVAVAAAVTVIQQSAVLPLLPRLQAELDIGVGAVSWTFTIGMLVGAVATLLCGRFGDMYGRRRMLLLLLGALFVGSVIAACATTLTVLLLGRAVQGLSVAVIPIAIGIVRDASPPERVASAIGLVSAMLGVGSGVGMVLAGVLAEFVPGFRPVFAMLAALAAGAFLLAVLVVRDHTPPRGGRPDVLGAVLLSAALVALLLGITEGSTWGWTSLPVLGLFLAAVVLAVVWVQVERRVAEPLVDIAMLVHRGTVGASASGLLLGFALFGGFSLMPRLVQAPSGAGYGLGASVLEAGLYLLPVALLMTAISMRIGPLIRRFSAPSVVAVGAVLTGGSGLWLVLGASTARDVLASASLLGVGIGLAYSALGTMAVEHVAVERTGVAAAVNSLARMVGGAVAGAVTSAVLAANQAPGSALPTAAGYQWGFGITAGVAVLAAVCAGWFGLVSRRR